MNAALLPSASPWGCTGPDSYSAGTRAQAESVQHHAIRSSVCFSGLTCAGTDGSIEEH